MSSTSVSLHCGQPRPHSGPLTHDKIIQIDAYWRASNYLCVGQIYLKHNPLLLEPLKAEHISPRLLGHWGTSPGLSLIYAHMNRIISERSLNTIYLAGPGHGGPAIIANVYLDGTYSEIYPEVSQDIKGITQLFRQFSTPGGVPSHVSVSVPGSINEGGELGYCLYHAFGSVFDNPDLIALTMIGDGEAETAPLEGGWKGISFLNPIHDGAVLPILHLNGYKIAGPTVLGRETDENINSLLSGHGYEVLFLEYKEDEEIYLFHRRVADILDSAIDKIQSIQKEFRTKGNVTHKPRWPAIVMRTPKGFTGPKCVDGIQIEGTFRAHQVPLSEIRSNPSHLAELERWLKSYRPHELFDSEGKLNPEIAKLVPAGDLRMGSNPHANGGKLMKKLLLPDVSNYSFDLKQPATERIPSTARLGQFCRDIYKLNPTNFRLFCPDETNSNKLGAVFEVENRAFMNRLIDGDDKISHSGRVMEVLSEHACEGWLEGYTLTGRHGLFASYEAFVLIVASMAAQHCKWLQVAKEELPWRAPVPSLNILLSSTCWRNDHNGFSHQSCSFADVLMSKKGTVVRIYLPADANSLLSVADHCFASTDYINIIIIDKQPQFQYLTIEQAKEHCRLGASKWEFASNEVKDEAEIVLASAGDIVTMETVAAAHWLRQKCPELAIRVVNVVDLMTLFDVERHPHGMNTEYFSQLFGSTNEVVFSYHGTPSAIHDAIHKRANPTRFHVKGYIESGTTTTPFEMLNLNRATRFHIAREALKRSINPAVIKKRDGLFKEIDDFFVRHSTFIKENYEDLPEIQNWKWTN